ncbi:unnamed protein product [Nezara viridula]|uniref:UDP-glucose:glycoprotein glucosyltransferase n=1 Tax=Nezara viridula TaxID=85310 RepID=A0A9P0HBH6_NEZVI|nr:unnamed protein product [Nezara viridula]
MELLKIIVLLLVTSLDYVLCKKKPKSVSTVIDAKWDSTPLVLEMAEFLADENESFFWDYIDSISSLNPSLVEAGTDKEYYDRALNVSKKYLSTTQVSLLEFALSLHVYSPRVEMFNQIAKEKEISCQTAVDIGGTVICDCDKILDNINEVRASSEVNSEEVLRVDHKYSNSDGIVVILYGELGTLQFSRFHKILKEEAEKGHITYIIRHWIQKSSNKKLRLSGYGVELQMKSTEYKVQDDTKVEGNAAEESEEEEEEVEGLNFHRLKQLYPDRIENFDKLRQNLLETSSELAPLKVWQFQELSLQAAQRIMSAPKEEVLHVLTYISSNFPTQARSLVKTVVSQELKTEMRLNQDKFSTSLHLQPSDTALFINGMYFDLETQDIFTILEYIREELRVMESLHIIGLTDKKLSKSLLALDLNGGGVDFALDIRDSAVVWINDIELDKQYRRWSSSLLDLLRPTFPGMLRSVRKNLYNLVVIGDPSKKEVVPLIKLLQSFLIHNAPLHLGIVFSVDETKNGYEDSGIAMLNAFNYVSEIKDVSQALNFITDVYASVANNDIAPADIHKLLKSKFPGFKQDEVFGPESDYNTGIKLSIDFISKSGLRNLPQVLLNGVALPEKSLNADEFEEAVLNEIMVQTPNLQKAVYKGELTDKDNVIDYIMSQPNVMPRLNERVLSSTRSHYLPLPKFTNKLTLDMIDSGISYLSSKSSKQGIHLLTNWIVCDLRDEDGRSVLQNAIEQMEGSGKIRIGLIINERETKSPSCDINRIALAVLRQLPSDKALEKVKDILQDFPAIEAGIRTFSDYGVSPDQEEIETAIQLHRQFSKEILNFDRGVRGIVNNGRLIGPLQAGEDFTVDDFSLLERFSLSTYVDKIYTAIAANSVDLDTVTSDMLMKSVSLLASRPESKSRFEITPTGEDFSVVKLMANDDGPAFDLVAIVDPVSSGAHIVGYLLSTLQQVVRADIRIFLNCVEKNSDMPLKSFYRYVLEPSLQFTSSGSLGSGPVARFSNMPGTPLLTQNMLVPDNWMVENIASPHDLDNIKLDQVDSNVHSQFELEYLIVEGHCFDSVLGSPPRGLQITLGTDRSPTEFDTIVMANLGYFQLKANPGLWKLRLRHGRSEALYDITGYSFAGVEYPVNSSEIKVVLSSFRAHTVKLKVTKKPDKSGIDLLGEDTEEQSSLWGSITNTFGGGSKADAAEGEQEPINIFSLASGHLYERFLRIMMLSVLKNTKSPVKFWFLKNYLSPTLKDFLPRMAKHYGFQYELVQYKWPRWLHQQTEKQRIIWGYKILFLDVLFPLDVKKIIFVDADQVVRADMKELVDLDLGGAPYGYTPFCESRTEMDGFRFWKSGYWRNHLQGRKYHISALYVVDLKRFRRIAAGDRLRGQYQALSQDPNSLSNLDQDLPNNMIHQVAIKSLPQEWLWCETWCDDSSKKRAKTIDLCNNPMTKEAKLTAAMRIVGEWKDYDNEIKRLQLQLGETEDHEEEAIVPPVQVPEVHEHSEL